MAIDMSRIPDWYFEDLIADTFRGLDAYACDQDCDSNQVALYRPGAIVRAKGRVEAVPADCAPVATCRFLIFSNRMRDMSMLSGRADAGALNVHAAFRRPYFKVIDTTEKGGVTQVTLLHLIDDERLPLWYEGPCPEAERDLARRGRSIFATCLLKQPTALDRVRARRCTAAGLSDAEMVSSREPSVPGELPPICRIGFRSVSGRLVYIQEGKRALRHDVSEWDELYPGLLAYGYLDSAHGLMFAVLCSAHLNSNAQLETRYDLGVTGLRLEAETISELGCRGVLDPALYDFKEDIDRVRAETAEADRLMGPTRSVDLLDEFRVPMRPDEIRAVLYSTSRRIIEDAHLLLVGLDGQGVTARLLEDPVEDFGVRRGDVLPIAFADLGNDQTVCLALVD